MPECRCRKCGKQFDAPLEAKHKLLCGDARSTDDVGRLFAGAKSNVAITSPPCATQREYDPSSGFKPVPPEEYVEWFRAVAAGVRAVLAPDGSYFLYIKAHADEGERNLYVMDLLLAHRRQWGWRFVDDFCWRKTDNGVPGGWEAGSRTRSNRSTISANSNRSSSGRSRSGTSPTTALNTPRTIRNQHRAADCSAPGRVEVRQPSRARTNRKAGTLAWRARAT